MGAAWRPWEEEESGNVLLAPQRKPPGVVAGVNAAAGIDSRRPIEREALAGVLGGGGAAFARCVGAPMDHRRGSTTPPGVAQADEKEPEERRRFAKGFASDMALAWRAGNETLRELESCLCGWGSHSLRAGMLAYRLSLFTARYDLREVRVQSQPSD